MSLRGTRRRPWLELRRDERERGYLSYQLFSLRRAAKGPSDDVRDTLPGKSFYDTERIRFTAAGLDVAYSMLYQRDKKLITPQALAIAGLEGLTALWVDQGRINEKRRGVLRGRWSVDEFRAIEEAFDNHGFQSRYSPFSNGQLLFEFEVVKEMRRKLSPYLHKSMQTKLRLRQASAGKRGSQPADQGSSQLLRVE